MKHLWANEELIGNFTLSTAELKLLANKTNVSKLGLAAYSGRFRPPIPVESIHRFRLNPSMTQSLPEWIGSHVRCFEFFGGVTESVVPDNLKTGVSKANCYEPDINPTYLDLARH